MLNDTHSHLCLAGSQSQWSPSWPSPVWFCPAPSGSSVWPWNLRYLNESDFCSIIFLILHFVFYSTNSYLCNYYYPLFPIENNTIFLQVFFQKTSYFNPPPPPPPVSHGGHFWPRRPLLTYYYFIFLPFHLAFSNHALIFCVQIRNAIKVTKFLTVLMKL